MTKKEQKKQYYIEKKEELESMLDDSMDNILINKQDMENMMNSFVIEGLYDYSLMNTIMIILQGGTVAQSYKKWTELNRTINKGEKANIYIYRPFAPKHYICQICKKTFHKIGAIKKHLQTHNVSFSKKAVKTVELKTLFSLTPIFDIKQTSGEDLKYKYNSPEIDIDIDYEQIKDKISKYYNFDIQEDYTGIKRGYVNYDDNIIHLSTIANKTDKVKTLIHETAHKLLKHTKDMDKSVKEVEAEAVSLLVSSAIGMDIELEQAYIDGYKQGKKDIRKKKIISVVNDIIRNCLNIKGNELIKNTALKEAV